MNHINVSFEDYRWEHVIFPTSLENINVCVCVANKTLR